MRKTEILFFIMMILFLSMGGIVMGFEILGKHSFDINERIRFVVDTYYEEKGLCVFNVYSVDAERDPLAFLFGKTDFERKLIRTTKVYLEDWSYNEIPVGNLPTGFYEAEAVFNGETKTWKFSVTSIKGYYILTEKNVLFVFDENGKPAESAKLLLKAENGPIFLGEAGKDGTLIKSIDSLGLEYGDVLLVLHDKQISVFSFDLWLPKTMKSEEGVRAFVITDRPVYKPGDEIRLKVFLREFKKNSYSYAEFEQLSVSLFDPLGNRVFHRVITDVDGSFSLAIPTSSEWRIGTYRFTMNANGFQESEWINVLHYVKPAYGVEIELPEEIFASNLNFTVKASYHFGAPLSGGWVRVNVYDSTDDKLIFSGEAILNDEGEKSFTVNTKDIKKVTELEVEAYVWDESGVEVRTTGKTTYHPADYEIQLDVPESISSGSKVLCTVNASKDQTLNYIVKRWDETIASGAVTINEGKGTFEFIADRAGLYKVEIHDGDLIVAKDRLYVGYWFGYQEESARVIMPEKTSVKPGEKLRLEFSGEGILYVDVIAGEEIEHHYLGPLRTLEYQVPPALKKDSIQIYATFIRGGIDYYTLDIDVIQEKPMFSLFVMPSKDVYKPGEEARIVIKNTAPEAVDLALTVVDKPIVEMFGESWNRLDEDVYPRMPTVSRYRLTQQYWFSRRVFSKVSGIFYEKTLATTKEEALGIPEAPQSLRERFEDVALWLPNLKVEDVITVTFKLPDNLTTWHVRATGMGESSVVDGSAEVRVTKELTVRIAVPEFLVEGDRLRLPVMIRNDSLEFQELEVTLTQASMSSTHNVLLGPAESISLPLEIEAPSSETLEVAAWASGISMFDGEKREIQVLDRYIELAHYDSGMGSGRPVGSHYVYPKYSFDRRVKISLTPNLGDILYEAVEDLVKFPYGCTEQTMSSFLPAIAVRRLGILKSPILENIDEITAAGLNRLYAFQHGDGGWGWWKDDDSDPFMTAYVLLGMKYLIESGIEVIPDSIKSAVEWLMNNLEYSDGWRYWFSVYVLSFYAQLPKEELVFRPAEDAASAVFKALVLREKALIDEIKERYVVESGHLAWVESNDWFANDILLTSVFITILEGDDPLLPKMTSYLISKRRGAFWNSTKDTAFVVLGLSRFVTKGERFVTLKVNGSTVISRNISHAVEIEIEAEKETEIVIEGDTNGLVYSISYLYKSEGIPPELRASGAVEKVTREIRRVVKFRFEGEEDSAQGILLIPLNSEYFISEIEFEKELSEIPEHTLCNSFWRIGEDNKLYLRGWETGLKLEGDFLYCDQETALASGTLYQEHSGRLLGNGVFRLSASQLDVLRVGGMLAHVLRVEQRGGDYYVLEDPLPSSALSLEDFREPIVGRYDKFGWYEYESWWARREFRKEKVVYFFRGWDEELHYVHFYRLRFPGIFTILPTKVWNMYDPASVGYSDIFVIQVKP
ncbi:MAG: alpha-2-macroglobulin [Thermotogota bacterium]|nr:alpha-2-macroglobulin [Thermotogota bacterium]